MSSLDEARERLAIAGSTGWDTQDEHHMEWVRTNLASAQVSATIAVAEALERLVAALEPETTAWSSSTHMNTMDELQQAKDFETEMADAAEEVAELTPTQTEEPF